MKLAHCLRWNNVSGANFGRRHNIKGDNIPGVQYPPQENSFHAPDRFLMVLDMDMGTLGFVAKGKYLGVSHTGLKGKTVFPIVSSVWGHCEVRGTMWETIIMNYSPVRLV